MSLPSLDDPAVLHRIDPLGMIDLILAFPEQCEKAAEIAAKYQPSVPLKAKPRAIIMAGLGGSAIAGEIVGSLVRGQLSCPWATVRDYNIPNYVDADSLVIVESYSGNTEETLSAYNHAKERGARIVCVTSGGKLADLARQDGNDLVMIPAGQPPRSALGFMLIPMLFVLEKLGVIEGWTLKIPDAIALMKSLRARIEPSVQTDENDAKMLARELYGRIPLLYGSAGYTGAFAVRWKCQFNENSKIHAFTNVFPELNHNEILAWERAELQSESFTVVLLRDPTDKSRIADRIRITHSLIPKGYPVHDIALEGKNELERLLWGCHFADLVTEYLAVLNKVDPYKMAGIDYLKSELAKI